VWNILLAVAAALLMIVTSGFIFVLIGSSPLHPKLQMALTFFLLLALYVGTNIYIYTVDKIVE